jgi:integrase/recombinase XerD
MATHNPDNERIKRKYLAFLKQAKGQSEDSVDAAAKALARFEAANRFRDFRAFHFEQAVAFKKHLAEQTSLTTGGRLSKATMHATLAHLKRFFQWLTDKPGYKSLQYSDAEYFNLSDKDIRVATARRERPAPTLEQVKHVIALMPGGTDIERRDRALMAFTLMTGARDSALASMKLKHVDIAAGSVFQDAREVETKFSKSFTTYFFNVGDDVRQVFDAWVTYLRHEKLWGRPWAWRAGTGAQPHQSGRYSGALSRLQDFRTSTRTASGRLWSNSDRPCARTPNSSRHGARTSAMRVC